MKLGVKWAKTALGVVTFGLALMSAFDGYAQSSASVLMYHRFGESDFPSTNIKMEQFEAHLKEIKSGDYNVLPLTDLVDKLKAGEELPDKTLSITIDDGYESIYEKAYPRFKEAFQQTRLIGDMTVICPGNRSEKWQRIHW